MSRKGVIPYLLYKDLPAASQWLQQAFGFTVSHTMERDGKMTHAELLGEEASLVMLGCPGENYKSPKESNHASAHLYVYTADLNKKFVQAKAAGATVLQPPELQPYGDRTFCVADLEGHRWYFASTVDASAASDVEQDAG